MKKGDICLIIIAAIFLFLWFFPKNQGSDVKIYVDGKLYKKMPLDKDARITVESEFGKNTVLIKNSVVTVTDADCPDRLCEKERISKSNKSIVCLPNRLSIVIENQKSKDKTDVIL